ncbi:hypothetical protein [uncultured Sulfitobacter sp.]|uniref:hypothetical protein n=1 Tax=Sulfitobacter sp. SH22 TaxID=3421172 RepID=UPI0025E179DE|nr:hypothetical protein [uncultured Sulfitobacter sp.]
MTIYQSKTSFIPATYDLSIERAQRARDLDKFYTKSEIVRQCVDDFEKWAGIDLTVTQRDILEPSAGAGAFLDYLPSRTLAYDIMPEDSRIGTQDFLKLERNEPAIVIGNPPFGKACSLAVPFFNHAAKFASHIGFIIPRTFEKASVQNKLDRNFHLVEQRVLARESFTLERESYSVPCVFQVWERRDELRPLISLPRVHPDFDFVTRDEADFAFQRIGARAGAVKTSFGQVSASSHHFLRARRSVAELLSTFRGIDFSEAKARTAGNPSISKTEIVALYAAAQGRMC